MFYRSFQGSVGRVAIYTTIGCGVYLTVQFIAMEVVKWAPVAVANLAPHLSF